MSEAQTSLQKVLSFLIVFGLMFASFILGTRWQEYDHGKHITKHREIVKKISESVARVELKLKANQ